MAYNVGSLPYTGCVTAAMALWGSEVVLVQEGKHFLTTTSV